MTEKENFYGMLVLLRLTSDTVASLRIKELKKYGITPQQSGALMGIRALGKEATPAKLARLLSRGPNTMSINLTRMEKQGLIKKTIDLHARGVIRLSLTQKGEAAYENAKKLDSIRKLIKSIPDNQLEQLWALLETVRTAADSNEDNDTLANARIFNRVLEQP
jgi:DNA-binding MarR family transcriptional regulator